MGEDKLVKGIQLADATAKATAEGPSVTIYSLSMLIVTIAFIYGVLLEQQNGMAGDRADYMKPIKSLILFIVLLTFYGTIATKLIALVKVFGSLEGAGQSGSIFVHRAKVFWQSMASPQVVEGMDMVDNDVFAYLTVLFNQIYTVAAGITFVFTAAVIWALKIVQHVMTNVLISMGPFVIALSAFPGPTRKLLAGWFMAIIEVTAWGVVAAVLNRHMNSGWGKIDIEMANNTVANPFEHMIYNLLYAFAYAMIPVITSVVVRGSSAAGLGPSTHAVKGAAMAAGGFAMAGMRGAVSAAQRGSGAAKGAASAANAVGGTSTAARAGDSASAARRASFARSASIKKQQEEK